MRQGSIRKSEAKPTPAGTKRKHPIEKAQEKARVAKAAPKLKGSKLRNPEKRLVEPSAEYAAISEILRVMSESPGDVGPVLDTVAEQAAHLCEAPFAGVLLADGDLLRSGARYSLDGTKRDPAPLPLKRSSIAGRAVLDRVTIHHDDVVPLLESEYPDAVNARVLGHRAVLAVPLIREGKAYGAIFLFRREPRPFSPDRIGLVETFARQAAIAIENVRQFNETQEALERQTAISEILRVMSRSPVDVQPMLNAVVERAAKLCEASDASVSLAEGDKYCSAAHFGSAKKAMELGQLIPLTRGSVTGRAIIDRTMIHLEDVAAVPEDEYPTARQWQRIAGHRTLLAVPLMREDRAIGVLALWRLEVRPFTEKQINLVKTFADQAAIAIENVRLFNETKEALEQQMATSEILRVISQSPTDVQPVFDTIAKAALKLCSAAQANVFTFDGQMIHVAALAHADPRSIDALGTVFPRPPGRDTAVARAVLTGSVVAIPDILEDPEYGIREAALASGFRGALAVPLMRQGNAIGAIALGRPEPGPFPEKQIGLLRTFADQAVIAIENVRLFNETKEALEHQTATSEILRVISRSPTNVRPVFDTIVEAALRLCGATSSNVVTFDGELIHLAAFAPAFPRGVDIALHQTYPRPPSRDTANARAVLTRSVVVIPDVLEDRDYAIGARAVATGYRSVVSVPLMREESPIGAITVARPEPGPFPEKQIALLQTFADQAVIAIENVRLFTELTHNNRALTQAHAQVSEALQRQTATSEILSVISQSPTDVQPVFETIAMAAMKLCGGNRAHVFTSDGKQIQVGAFASTNPVPDDEFRKHFPRRLGNDLATSRAILTGGVVVIPDVLDDAEYALKELAPAGGFRSVLAVPLLREGSPIGAIGVSRPEAGPFLDNQIALLQTFSAQAVIAIENVRLFNETKEALERQTATSEILRVISQSPRDVQPVFDSIATLAMRLCGGSSVSVTTYDGQLLHLVAVAGEVTPKGGEAVRQAYPRPVSRDTASTRAVLTCSIVAIPDVLEDPDFVQRATTGEFRSVVGVPLIRDGRPIGAIAVGRPEPGSFPDKQIALLQTFADQAVIAIENVRLFTELETRTLQLTRSVGELKALGEVGQAVSSTLDLETVLSTIVSRAAQLAGMDGGSIWEYDETHEEFYLRATDRASDDLVEALRAMPIRKGEGALGRLAMTGEPVQIRDIAEEPNYPSRLREIGMRGGLRSVLAVPLLREDHLLGALAVNRNRPGEFAQEVIELLKTFATQSALAIQNARLFREVEAKSRELEAASRHKSEFLANMSHELRTPLNAIIGFSEVLSERMFGEINEKQAEYISDILESGQHLLSLINDILDLSKIEAGRMELELSEFDLPGLIENTMTLVRERAVRRGIALGRSLDERLGMIRADERKVKQVLLNLLSNALKFTPEGGKINVRADANDGAAEISVTDTGVGIAPEDQEKVFEEFRQVGTASKKVEGTGLGLAISRKFIELHGGKIWVKSQVGSGSTFAFTLPLQKKSPV